MRAGSEPERSEGERREAEDRNTPSQTGSDKFEKSGGAKRRDQTGGLIEPFKGFRYDGFCINMIILFQFDKQTRNNRGGKGGDGPGVRVEISFERPVSIRPGAVRLRVSGARWRQFHCNQGFLMQ